MDIFINNLNSIPEQVSENANNIEQLQSDFAKLKLNYKGDYVNDDKYDYNDVVIYQNKTYLHISETQTQGVLPTDTSTWAVYIDPPKGADGKDFNAMGTWISDNEYYAYDYVDRNGSSYYCTKDINGSSIPPESDPEHWQLVASKGEQGQTGPQGPKGLVNFQGGLITASSSSNPQIIIPTNLQKGDIFNFTITGGFSTGTWYGFKFANVPSLADELVYFSGKCRCDGPSTSAKVLFAEYATKADPNTIKRFTSYMSYPIIVYKTSTVSGNPEPWYQTLTTY